MQCLYCKKRLGFFASKKNPFCSELHESSYHDEQSGLALRRVMDPLFTAPIKPPPLRAGPATKAPSADGESEDNILAAPERVRAAHRDPAEGGLLPQGFPEPVAPDFAAMAAPGSGYDAPIEAEPFSTGVVQLPSLAGSVLALDFAADSATPDQATEPAALGEAGIAAEAQEPVASDSVHPVLENVDSVPAALGEAETATEAEEPTASDSLHPILENVDSVPAALSEAEIAAETEEPVACDSLHPVLLSETETVTEAQKPIASDSPHPFLENVDSAPAVLSEAEIAAEAEEPVACDSLHPVLEGIDSAPAVLSEAGIAAEAQEPIASDSLHPILLSEAGITAAGQGPIAFLSLHPLLEDIDPAPAVLSQAGIAAEAPEPIISDSFHPLLLSEAEIVAEAQGPIASLGLHPLLEDIDPAPAVLSEAGIAAEAPEPIVSDSFHPLLQNFNSAPAVLSEAEIAAEAHDSIVSFSLHPLLEDIDPAPAVLSEAGIAAEASQPIVSDSFRPLLQNFDSAPVVLSEAWIATEEHGQAVSYSLYPILEQEQSAAGTETDALHPAAGVDFVPLSFAPAAIRTRLLRNAELSPNASQPSLASLAGLAPLPSDPTLWLRGGPPLGAEDGPGLELQLPLRDPLANLSMARETIEASKGLTAGRWSLAGLAPFSPGPAPQPSGEAPLGAEDGPGLELQLPLRDPPANLSMARETIEASKGLTAGRWSLAGVAPLSRGPAPQPSGEVPLGAEDGPGLEPHLPLRDPLANLSMARETIEASKGLTAGRWSLAGVTPFSPGPAPQPSVEVPLGAEDGPSLEPQPPLRYPPANISIARALLDAPAELMASRWSVAGAAPFPLDSEPWPRGGVPAAAQTETGLEAPLPVSYPFANISIARPHFDAPAELTAIHWSVAGDAPLSLDPAPWLNAGMPLAAEDAGSDPSLDPLLPLRYSLANISIAGEIFEAAEVLTAGRWTARGPAPLSLVLAPWPRAGSSPAAEEAPAPALSFNPQLSASYPRVRLSIARELFEAPAEPTPGRWSAARVAPAERRARPEPLTQSENEPRYSGAAQEVKFHVRQCILGVPGAPVCADPPFAVAKPPRLSPAWLEAETRREPFRWPEAPPVWPSIVLVNPHRLEFSGTATVAMTLSLPAFLRMPRQEPIESTLGCAPFRPDVLRPPSRTELGFIFATPPRISCPPLGEDIRTEPLRWPQPPPALPEVSCASPFRIPFDGAFTAAITPSFSAGAAADPVFPAMPWQEPIPPVVALETPVPDCAAPDRALTQAPATLQPRGIQPSRRHSADPRERPPKLRNPNKGIGNLRLPTQMNRPVSWTVCTFPWTVSIPAAVGAPALEFRSEEFRQVQRQVEIAAMPARVERLHLPPGIYARLTLTADSSPREDLPALGVTDFQRFRAAAHIRIREPELRRSSPSHLPVPSASLRWRGESMVSEIRPGAAPVPLRPSLQTPRPRS